MAANIKTIGPITFGNTSASTGTLPYTSAQLTTFQVIPASGATVAVEASLDNGTTWTAVPSLSAVTTATLLTHHGPLPLVRIAVTVAGTGTVHMAWGDNR